MRRSAYGLAMLVFLSAPCVARADELFNITGTLQDSTGTFAGTLDYNLQQQSGYVQGTVTDGAFSFTLPRSYLGEQLGEGSYTLFDVFAVDANFDLSLYVPDALLANDTAGALCSEMFTCPYTVPGTQPPQQFILRSSFYDGDFPYQQFLNLTATPVAATAVTPEPGTLTLLGTGLLGLAGLRRRWSRS